MSPFDDQELTAAILKHLRDNPAGLDTLEGIARFWVLRQRIEANVKEVEGIVTRLVERGLLKERNLQDESGDVVEHWYFLNPSRASEIDALVQNMKS